MWTRERPTTGVAGFPFLFGGAFIEAVQDRTPSPNPPHFSAFLAETFIKARSTRTRTPSRLWGFPILFGKGFHRGGLSLGTPSRPGIISLPFGRDFH